MFNILPVRKLIKVVSPKRGLARRDRVITPLAEDLDLNVVEQHGPKYGHIYFVIFIFSLIYFIHLLRFHYDTTTYFPVFSSSEEANKSSPLNGSDESLPFCSVNFQKIGNISINKTITEISETDYTEVQTGGYYTPKGCRSRHRLALLVPYRNRKQHLAAFLFNIHPFLMNQKLEYRIFVIEQKGIELFNRGRVFNAGFKEAKKFGSWKCVVLHDVDLLPLDRRILYTCPIWPRQMCAKIRENTNPSFHTYFGGVSAMTVQHFEKVNGFSNMYWGWGGEDTDLFVRIRMRGLPVVSYKRKIAVFTALNHTKLLPNLSRQRLLNAAANRCHQDGLSSLNYSVESVTLHHLYTHIFVDIDPYDSTK